MANIYSPPGMLSVYEVLRAIGIYKLDKEIRMGGLVSENQSRDKILKDNYRRIYTLYDSHNLSELEAKLKKINFLRKKSICIIEITIDSLGRNRQVAIDQKNGIILGLNSNFVDRCKAMHYLRRLLSEKYLEAYVQHNYTYHKMPPGFWHLDNNWYRLLADGSLCDGPTIEDAIVGSVYFKKEDVEYCLSIDIDEQPRNHPKPQTFLPENSRSLINLNTYSTPWLQVLNAVYEEHEKDTLAQVSKISVECFIKDYIKKHELDIPPSDVPFLAKFIRLAEQREGKKYHAALKIKKIEGTAIKK